MLTHPPGGPRLIHVDVHDAAHGHTHLDLRYLLVAPDRDPAPPPGESPEAALVRLGRGHRRGRRGPRRCAARRPAPARGRRRDGRVRRPPDPALAPARSAGVLGPGTMVGDDCDDATPTAPHDRRAMTTADGAPETGNGPEAPVRPLARLLEVQDHDTVIDQIRHRRATLPERAELADVDRQLGALDVRTKELRQPARRAR